MRRREFLELGVASLFVPRLVRAQTEAFGAASHLLILNAWGGLRSHALFNAVGTNQHNPWGVQPAAPGTEWTLGGVCGEGPFNEITNDVAVLACVDHVPRDQAPVVDHVDARRRLGTGHEGSDVGLLTRINGFDAGSAPTVAIGRSDFTAGGADAGTPPLELPDAEDFESTLRLRPFSKELDARRRLDRRFAASLPSHYAKRTTDFSLSKEQGYTYSDTLRRPELSIRGEPSATLDGVSNEALLDTLGTRGWGPSVAMAVRWLQLGSRAVAVTFGNYDHHAEERARLPGEANDLVRQLAGLRALLATVSHPSGGTYYDRTVVAVVSEFSRNNTMAHGFNSGNGSDHRQGDQESVCRNQAIALMGGPISGGRLIGSTDEQMRPTGPVHLMANLHATLLDLLGIPHADHFPGHGPIRELYA